MNTSIKPSLPLPEPLRGSELGTFAHDTIVRRLPDIARRTIEENTFPPSTVKALRDLIQEIPNRPIRPLNDPEAPDSEAWDDYVRPYLGEDWLSPPWFFIEFYFYRRILEATDYFQSGSPGFLQDPFLIQKQKGIRTALDAIRGLSLRVNRWVQKGDMAWQTIVTLLIVEFWGNQVDLSIWPVEDDGVSITESQGELDHIVVNDSRDVADHLLEIAGEAARVDIIIDNAGFELVTDLCMADYLLGTGLVGSIHLHPKGYPIFVSDAMTEDIESTVTFLTGDSDRQVQEFARRLASYIEAGQLRLRANEFWTSPCPMWEMPVSLRSDLTSSGLVISKGDANYRRLLGDRHWAETASFGEVLSYFPAPITALRTNKSEVICGLEPGTAEAIGNEDPDWRTNGQWGEIQFRGYGGDTTL